MLAMHRSWLRYTGPPMKPPRQRQPVGGSTHRPELHHSNRRTGDCLACRAAAEAHPRRFQPCDGPACAAHRRQTGAEHKEVIRFT
eukprot:694205-Rhodomonas_salina.1